MITKENYYTKLNLNLKITTKAILDFLVKYADKDYTCYPSQQYIADKLGLSRATVNRHIMKLEEMKYITISKHKRSKEQKFFNNIYHINILADTKKNNFKRIKNVLKNKFREIEKKLFNKAVEMPGESISDMYDIEEKNFDFNIDVFLDNLIDRTGLKKINILSTIVNIQEQLRNGHIYNIKNYINKAFSNAMREEEIRDITHYITKALPGDFKENLLLIS